MISTRVSNRVRANLKTLETVLLIKRQGNLRFKKKLEV